MAVTNTNIAIALENAAQVLERDGWTKGVPSYPDQAGPQSLVGALWTSTKRWDFPMSLAVDNEVWLQIEMDYDSNVYMWESGLNDKRVITRMFRRAARRVLARK